MATRKTAPAKRAAAAKETARAAAPTPAVAAAAKREEETAGIEREKLHGETDSQRKIREYHEGEFQTTDPVTGQKRTIVQPPLLRQADR